MKALIVDTPAPACILRCTDPARAHVSSVNTDVRRTWEPHRPIHAPQHYGDDYDLVIRQDWLSAPGGFR